MNCCSRQLFDHDPAGRDNGAASLALGRTYRQGFYNGPPDRILTHTADDLTRRTRLWWEQHPMDYLGHQGRPDLSDERAARAFFARIDREFHRAAWFAQPPDAPLFAGLI